MGSVSCPRVAQSESTMFGALNGPESFNIREILIINLVPSGGDQPSVRLVVAMAAK